MKIFYFTVDSFPGDEKDLVKSNSFLNLPVLEDRDIRSEGMKV